MWRNYTLVPAFSVLFGDPPAAAPPTAERGMAKAELSPADRRSLSEKENLAVKEPEQEVRLPLKSAK